jgi:hypothetical protein
MGGYSTKLYLTHLASDDRMIDKWLIINDLEGNSLIELLYRRLSGETEENYWKAGYFSLGLKRTSNHVSPEYKSRALSQVQPVLNLTLFHDVIRKLFYLFLVIWGYMGKAMLRQKYVGLILVASVHKLNIVQGER